MKIIKNVAILLAGKDFDISMRKDLFFPPSTISLHRLSHPPYLATKFHITF
jgi:hypothetical protein